MNVGVVRCLAVWGAVTAAALGVAWWSVAGLRLTGPFDQLVAGVAGLALGGCAAWAWLVTTVVVAQAIRGATPTHATRGVPRWARRAVLAACGLAVLTAVPAHAGGVAVDGGGGAESVDGLPFPDRATGPARSARRETGPTHIGLADVGHTHVVRPGESLWSVASARLPDDASAARIASETAALYDLNRRAVGDDPDVIHPGQQLRVPAPHSPRREERP